MDVFTILSYINKISFLAFFITLLFLAYQFYMLKKESSLDKKDITNLPSFNENESPQILNYTKLNLPNISQDQKKTVFIKKNNQVILFSILTIFFLLFLIVIFFNFNKKEQAPTSQKSTVSLLISPTLTLEPTITVENQISPTLELSPTFLPLPSPTEVLLSFVSLTETPSFTLAVSKIESLPLTGFFDNIFLFFGLSFLFIFLAFIF